VHQPPALSANRPQGLVDVLDRILDKGLVVAGDVKVNLANVELLTVQIRLLICSIDKAEEVGLDWWRYDPALSGHGEQLKRENRDLRDRLKTLEEKLERLAPGEVVKKEK